LNYGSTVQDSLTHSDIHYYSHGNLCEKGIEEPFLSFFYTVISRYIQYCRSTALGAGPLVFCLGKMECRFYLAGAWLLLCRAIVWSMYGAYGL